MVNRKNFIRLFFYSVNLCFRRVFYLEDIVIENEDKSLRTNTDNLMVSESGEVVEKLGDYKTTTKITPSLDFKNQILTLDSVTEGLIKSHVESIVDFQNEAVRKALIDLGWTPPKEKIKCIKCGTIIEILDSDNDYCPKCQTYKPSGEYS